MIPAPFMEWGFFLLNKKLQNDTFFYIKCRIYVFFTVTLQVREEIVCIPYSLVLTTIKNY